MECGPTSSQVWNGREVGGMAPVWRNEVVFYKGHRTFTFFSFRGLQPPEETGLCGSTVPSKVSAFSIPSCLFSPGAWVISPKVESGLCLSGVLGWSCSSWTWAGASAGEALWRGVLG